MACLTVVPAKDFYVAHPSYVSVNRSPQFKWYASLHKVPKPYEVLWRA